MKSKKTLYDLKLAADTISFIFGDIVQRTEIPPEFKVYCNTVLESLNALSDTIQNWKPNRKD